MLRRQSYSLPSFVNFPSESKGLCTLEKIPLFLFRVQTPPPASASEYLLGGIGRDESEDLTELPSPVQCSVKVKIPGYEPTLMNMRDGQIFPLGHQYRISCDSKDYRSVAFLQLNQEGREEFIVLLGFSSFFLGLRSSEMKWKLVMGFRTPLSDDIVTFRRRFYVTVRDTSLTKIYTFRIDPFSLRMTRLMPLNNVGSLKYLVPCGNDDELFMVEKFLSFYNNVIDFSRFTCKVSRLHEESDLWVEVSDLGDRVLFIRQQGNVSCSAKELPDGCGVSGNSILFTNELDNGTYVYKYGVDTGRGEDDINCWNFSGENRVTILSTSPVVSFRVEH
uniref:KIB1-4 beta-propeller domain-containing protein n=2 Tax=Brassica campestris TaxID=3711 RepID=M4ETI1_BRACM